MTRLVGLPPVIGPGTRLLVLGSFPGVASLRAQQYYGHPQNQFWKILSALWAQDLQTLPYEQRLAVVRDRGLGIWDVYAACEREGSLDTRIDSQSIVPNDFATFFDHHPAIRRVFFNGTMAETVFRRHVLQTLPPLPLRYHRLPSTSPANAAFSFARRLEAWQLVAADDNNNEHQDSST